MQVSEVMTRGAECTRPDATLRDAAGRMKDLDVGPLPVCGDNELLVGMITDRDIAIRGVAEGRDPDRATVRDVMTPDVIYCFDDQDVREAAKTMQDHQVRRLVVLNRDKRLVGIVSLGDLAVDGLSDHATGSTLESVSQPSRPKR